MRNPESSSTLRPFRTALPSRCQAEGCESVKLSDLDQFVRFFDGMILCPVCGVGLRDDARFCDKCGVQLEAPDYQSYFYQPPADLVLQAITYLAQMWNQLDVQERIQILHLAGEAATGTVFAAEKLRQWWGSRKRLDQRQWQ
jgi:predicted amidophosphoribosyltransferase